MTSIPPIGVRFTGNVDDVSAAVRALTANVQGLGRATKAQSAETAAATRVTADLTARFSAAARAVDPFSRGLLNVKNQEIQAAQAAATLGKAIDPIAAKMAQAASGTEKFAAGLRALKAQQEAQAAQTKAGAASTSLLSGAGTALIGTLKGLAAGYGAVKILSFVNDSIDAAAALHDLAQKTGASVETLATLAFVGKRNEISADDLNVSFRKLAKTLGELRDGNQEATRTFARLGLSAKDLEGLTVDQKFLAIAAALARVPDGLEKAELATQLFGRAGADLIPLLNELAQRGLPELTREAARAGAAMSTEAADAADKFRDSLDDLKSSAAGASREIASPFLPLLTDLSKAAEELFARKPGGTLRRDLDDLAHLADALTFKFFNLRQATDNALGGPPGGFDDRFHARGLGPVALAQRPGPATDPKALEDEIRALAAIRDAGRLTEEQQARINVLVAQLTAEYDTQGTTLTRQAEILHDLDSLTKTRKASAEELTDAERQHLELMRAQAEEAGKLLKAEAERRQLAADAAREAGFRAALQQTGGVGSFEELIARQQRRARAPLPGTEPLTNSEVAARTLAERQADVDTFVRDLLAGEQKGIDSAEQLGKSLRDAVASGIGGLFDAVRQLGTAHPDQDAVNRLQSQQAEIARQIAQFGDVSRDQSSAAAQKVRELSNEYDALSGKIAEAQGRTFGIADAIKAAAKSMVDSLQQVISQLGAKELLDALSQGGGIKAVPGGLATQDVGQLAGLAPTLGTASAPGALGAEKIAAAAGVLSSAGAAVAVGGRAVAGGAAALEQGGGVVLAAGTGIRTGAGELERAGTIVLGAATAIKAAAAELAAASASAALLPVAPALGDLSSLAALAPAGFARGGQVATGGGPRGPADRLLAWFDPAEFIVNPRATRRHLPLLRALNHGVDIPGFADGGLVGELHPSLVHPVLAAPALPRVPQVPEGASVGMGGLIEHEIRLVLDRGLIQGEIRKYNRSRDGRQDHTRLSIQTRRARRES